MLPETRELYELEKLWTLRAYDEQLQKIPSETLPKDFILDAELTKWPVVSELMGSGELGWNIANASFLVLIQVNVGTFEPLQSNFNCSLMSCFSYKRGYYKPLKVMFSTSSNNDCFLSFYRKRDVFVGQTIACATHWPSTSCTESLTSKLVTYEQRVQHLKKY